MLAIPVTKVTHGPLAPSTLWLMSNPGWFTRPIDSYLLPTGGVHDEQSLEP